MKRLLILIVVLISILSSSKPVSAGNAGNCIFYDRTAWVFVVGEKSNGKLYPTENLCRKDLRDPNQKLIVPDFRTMFRRIA